MSCWMLEVGREARRVWNVIFTLFFTDSALRFLERREREILTFFLFVCISWYDLNPTQHSNGKVLSREENLSNRNDTFVSTATWKSDRKSFLFFFVFYSETKPIVSISSLMRCARQFPCLRIIELAKYVLCFQRHLLLLLLSLLTCLPLQVEIIFISMPRSPKENPQQLEPLSKRLKTLKKSASNTSNVLS